jgi:hypothetical protein
VSLLNPFYATNFFRVAWRNFAQLLLIQDAKLFLILGYTGLNWNFYSLRKSFTALQKKLKKVKWHKIFATL